MKDKRGIIPNRAGIEARPEIVEQREKLGDLEIGTMIGKNHKGAILTINDRLTRVLRMKQLLGKNADALAAAAIALLMPLKHLLHPITADNGKELSAHEKIAKGLGIDFYFAHPYHSWERGSNENLNGLIRQHIPKKLILQPYRMTIFHWQKTSSTTD